MGGSRGNRVYFEEEKMNKAVLMIVAMALIPGAAFAVDGQVLINQSTVMAAGGFPYIISSPGSYKLTGNLQMATTSTGNHAGIDIAIAINSSFVDLDLNGFAIIVTNNDLNLRHNYFAIAEIGTFSQVSIKNGNISVKSLVQMNFAALPYGIYLHSTTMCNLADVSIVAQMSFLGISTQGIQFDIGSQSLLRHNIIVGTPDSRLACPSLFVENVGLFNDAFPGCTGVNNRN
jgi:hypothetical protein